MIADTSLRNWLASPEQQRRAFQASASAGVDWRNISPLANLATALKLARSQQDVLDLIRDVIDQTFWLDECADHFARIGLSSPFSQPPFAAMSSPIQQGLILFSHPKATISASVIPIERLAAKKMNRPTRTSIGFSGLISIQKFLRAGNARIQIWHSDGAEQNFSLSSSSPCVRGDQLQLNDGDVIVLDGRRMSYEVERADSDILMIQAEIQVDKSPFLVEYDSQHHNAISVSSTDEAASRAQLLLSGMRAIEGADMIPAIMPCLADEHFFVRWDAVSHLADVAPNLARRVLHAFAQNDHHVEIREAARIALNDCDEVACAEAA